MPIVDLCVKWQARWGRPGQASRTMVVGEASKWDRFQSGELGSALSHTTLPLGGELVSCHLNHLGVKGLWPLLGHVWGLSTEACSTFCEWCRNFTMESCHIHVYLARILSCVLSKKRKEFNSCREQLSYSTQWTSAKKCVQLCLKPAMLLVWKLKEGCVSDCKGLIQKVKPFFLVLCIRVVIEEREEFIESNQWRVRQSIKIILNIDYIKPCIFIELYLVLYLKDFQSYLWQDRNCTLNMVELKTH